MNALRALVAAVILPGCAGCVPLVIQTQPSMDWGIRAEDGRPIPGAVLHFARIPVCFRRMNRASWLSRIPANDDGRVAVRGRKELLAPTPSWVSAAGYEPREVRPPGWGP